eukprot:CAMPEP_0183714590 /NCGR_PEP_ID=MMETSP0737-20130205/9068_1 /TAXON_ID=385413 /ORGANISM="Thalassiosira miniscula, Strain CCMP1093" /LENGTH=1419 /DNA_ID=CAMNT_0025943545 /DNA_START=24 /DNA_END=4283 /DNA_ORIENTATION=-
MARWGKKSKNKGGGLRQPPSAPREPSPPPEPQESTRNRRGGGGGGGGRDDRGSSRSDTKGKGNNHHGSSSSSSSSRRQEEPPEAVPAPRVSHSAPIDGHGRSSEKNRYDDHRKGASSSGRDGGVSVSSSSSHGHHSSSSSRARDPDDRSHGGRGSDRNRHDDGRRVQSGRDAGPSSSSSLSSRPSSSRDAGRRSSPPRPSSSSSRPAPSRDRHDRYDDRLPSGRSNGHDDRPSGRSNGHDDRHSGRSNNHYDDRSTHSRSSRREAADPFDEYRYHEQRSRELARGGGGRIAESGYRDRDTGSRDDRDMNMGRRPSHASSADVSRRSHGHRDNDRNNKPRSTYHDDRYEDHEYSLEDREQKQYEEYQDQLYHQQQQQQNHYSPQPPHQPPQSSLQRHLQQHQQQQQHQEQQQQQQQFSSTHRQFNLAPIYDEKKGKSENGKQQKNKKQSRFGGGINNSNKKKSGGMDPMVLAYLDSDDEDDDNDKENFLEEGVPKTHEDFYMYGDNDEEDSDDDDDDEEAPLNKRRSSEIRIQRTKSSVLSRSETCLNRSLLFAFAFVSFIFLRDHTPWWKEHKRRVALQKHHHHNVLAGTDDDDLKKTIDPMSVYNSNDDDSTHTRDHDPLHKYDEFTKDKPIEKFDKNNKYFQAKAGERISERKPEKSLHHGFMDETYEHRPEAEVSGSDAAEKAGVYDKEIDEEKAAFLKTVLRTPTKHKQDAGEEKDSESGDDKDDAKDDDNDGGGSDGAEEKDNAEEQVVAAALPPPPMQNAGDEAPVQESSGSETPSSNSQTNSDTALPNSDMPVQKTDDAVPIQASSGSDTPTSNSETGNDTSPIKSDMPMQESNETPMETTSGSDGSPEAEESSGSDVPASPQNNDTDDYTKEFMKANPGSGESPKDDIFKDIPNPEGGLNPKKIFPSDAVPDLDNSVNSMLGGTDPMSSIKADLDHLDNAFKSVLGDDPPASSGNDDVGAESVTAEAREMPLGDNGDADSKEMPLGDSSDADAKEMPLGDHKDTDAKEMHLVDSADEDAKEMPLADNGDADADADADAKEMPTGDNADRDTSAGSSSSGNADDAEAKKNPSDDNGSKDDSTASDDAPSSKDNTVAKSPILPQSSQPILNQGPMSDEDIKNVYKDSYYRWNHHFRSGDGESKDVPVFWRIPRSASGTVEAVMSYCYRMVLANSMGTSGGHDKDEEIAVITTGSGAQYINVDMARPEGIQRAKGMGLGSSGLADVVSTPFLFETADIFKDIDQSGKCFTLLRHPVDRAISLYHHYQIEESGNPNIAHYKGMSIDEFADEVAENNWMVRFLANKRGGALNWHDLEVAKEVFGRKCLVGLVDKAEESIKRYERFFGWDKKVHYADTKETCINQYLNNGDKRQEHPTYEGTDAWETLRKKNEYDVLLYEFAEKLYTQQASMYEDDS